MSILLAKNYVGLLDEVYKKASLTADLMTDPEMVRAGANAQEILVPKLTMDGLADYSRSSGYVGGDVSLEWETVKFNYDRGRKFTVDSMDDEETIQTAFGKLAAEFVRTKVVPEDDAFTFATIAGITGISAVSPGAALSDGAAVMAALKVGMDEMDEDEVPDEGRILYITPTNKSAIEALDTTKSRELLARFEKIVKVPQGRFYTAIDLLDGTTQDEEIGGYAKASGAKNINFMIIQKDAVCKHVKHTANNIITPEENQTSDGYIQKYRKYGLVDVYDNKVAGVYLHMANA